MKISHNTIWLIIMRDMRYGWWKRYWDFHSLQSGFREVNGLCDYWEKGSRMKLLPCWLVTAGPCRQLNRRGQLPAVVASCLVCQRLQTLPADSETVYTSYTHTPVEMWYTSYTHTPVEMWSTSYTHPLVEMWYPSYTHTPVEMWYTSYTHSPVEMWYTSYTHTPVEMW